MFKLVRPQVARHSGGYTVSILGYERVGLMEADGTDYEAEASFGSTFVVFESTVRRCTPVQSEALAKALQHDVAERMAAGLAEMGGPAEVA